MKSWPNLNGALSDYVDANWLRDSGLKKRLRAETGKMHQGQQMAAIARMVGARRVVEVGTFTGYSALCVAEALPADGRLWCCDVSEEWTSIGQRYWNEARVASKIELIIAPALETLAIFWRKAWPGRSTSPSSTPTKSTTTGTTNAALNYCAAVAPS